MSYIGKDFDENNQQIGLGAVIRNGREILFQQLVVKAAIAGDWATGGVVRTVMINFEGVTVKFYLGDTLPLWRDELVPQNSLLDMMNEASLEPMNI